MVLERVKRSYWRKDHQVTNVNEKYILGFLFICCLISFFLVLNYQLCFTTDHHLKYLADSVQLIWLYFNTQLVFKDLDVKSLTTFIRFHTLIACHAYVPERNRQTRNLSSTSSQ